MFESIYYVISWACLQSCPHCYDQRFKPYSDHELEDITTKSKAAFPHIVSHLPESMVYTDLSDQQQDGSFAQKIGRIILAGGEVLLEPVRSEVLYPLLETLHARYAARGGVKLTIQTTGDLLTPEIINDLLERNIWMISVSSLDDYHRSVVREGRAAFRSRLTAMFETAGMQESGLRSGVRRWPEEKGPVYSFFGATSDAWIGKLWPSGRAWENGLSTATFQDNFCNNWSGGLGFLNLGYSGSEVAIDPDGNLYPCCRKTHLPYGNLKKEPLLQILESLIGQAEFEAIASGHPERMGIARGLNVEQFLDLSRTMNSKGEMYVNRCIGCDRYHAEYLAVTLERLRENRRRQWS